MRERILGVLGLVLGLGATGYGLLAGSTGSGSYAAGQLVGIGFGLVLAGAGGWSLLKNPQKS